MRQRSLALVLLALLLGVMATSAVNAAEDPEYEPGFVEWDVKPVERLFVEGLDAEEAVLQRQRTDNAVGSQPVAYGNGVVPVFTVSSEPLQNPINATVNMTVFFSAYIDGVGGPQFCERQWAVDKDFTLIYSVDAGGVPVYDSVVTQVVDTDTSNSAMNFSGQRIEAFLSMDVGDVFTLSVSAQNNCIGSTIQVQWGAFEQNSGGIVMEGQLYEPEARVFVDAERRAHIEFEPLFPWGADDVKTTKWELWGPLAGDEKFVKDEDLIMETSTGRIRVDRSIPGNNTIWAWSGLIPLTPGDANLEFCIQTVSGDLNSDCHAFGIIRFDVEKADKGLASSTVFLSLTSVGSLIGFMVMMVRKDELPPLPILGAILLMTILFIPTAISQPNLGSSELIDDHARVFDTELYDENMQSMMVSELFDGKDALIIAIALPGTQNIVDQATELNKTLDLIADEVSIVHVLSGMDASATDVSSMKANYNLTWSTYVDIDESFTRSSPNGTSDSILVLDKSMRVVYSNAPSASSEEIISAVESINNGGSSSVWSYFSLIFGPGLFLFFLALPREEYEELETPLPIGMYWGAIIAASGAGIVLVNLPLLLATLAPIPSNTLFWVDIAMIVWLLEMSIVTARRGTPFEADFVGGAIHKLFPKNFRDWRGVKDMKRDTLIGIWMGWFGWFAFPALFSQGVGAAMLSGASGIFFGSIGFILIVLLGGATVLLLRIIASLGGSISRLFGEYGFESFAQYSGWCIVPLALWSIGNSILSMLEIGIL
ncbi:MAG: hypothetical protein OSA21_01655 [Candidatus Poseidoniaceae archaeon]|nr:hypothetical protein [Candidatus Poseidoniaceae archaeon]